MMVPILRTGYFGSKEDFSRYLFEKRRQLNRMGKIKFVTFISEEQTYYGMGFV